MQVIAHNRDFGGQSNGINRRCALLSSLWEAAQNLECPEVFWRHGRIHPDVSITQRRNSAPENPPSTQMQTSRSRRCPGSLIWAIALLLRPQASW